MRLITIVLICTAALLLGAGTLSPPITPVPMTTLPPLTTPQPLPTITPIAPSPPVPIATPVPLPTPLVLPSDAPPQILAVQLSDPVFHSGEVITGTVITSTNVTSVELRVASRSYLIPRADFGRFELSYRMPQVPFFFRGTYQAQVIARNATGVSAERDISVAVR